MSEKGTPRQPGAVVRITCKHCPDQVLVKHCISIDGTEFWQRNRNGLTVESVPTEDGRRRMRYRFKCPRPLCPYDAQLRWSTEDEDHTVTVGGGREMTFQRLMPDHFDLRIRSVLRLMVAAGVEEWTWNDVEADHWDIFSAPGVSGEHR